MQRDEQARVLAVALRHLAAGLSIIPVNTTGDRLKKPHFKALHGTGHSRQEWRKEQNRTVNIPTWQEFQTTRATPEEVTAWVERYQVNGFALVTGAISGVVGIDFDLDGIQVLDDLGWKAHVRTPSGGAHVYVRHPGFHVNTVKASGIKDPALRLPAGVDVRGDGGYIVLPPTTLEGRGSYVRTDERAFLSTLSIPLSILDGDRPCALRQVLGLTPPPPRAAPVRQRPVPTFSDPSGRDGRPPVESMVSRAAQRAWNGNGRNESAFWFAGQMRDNRYAQDEAEHCYDTLVDAFPSSDTKGAVTPFTLHEYLETVRSAYRLPPRRAWARQENQWTR